MKNGYRILAIATFAGWAAPVQAQSSTAPDALDHLRAPPGQKVRYEVFTTAEALSPADTNGLPDVYLRDVVAGTTELVSIGPDGKTGPHGSEEPSVSGDGSFVAFVTRNALSEKDDNDLSDVYAFDRTSRQVHLVSRNYLGGAGNAPSSQPIVSWGGQYVAFSSPASNIIRGDNNYVSDVFLWPRVTKIPRIVSRRADGEPFSKPSFLPSVSSAGVFVGFRSLEQIFGDQDGRDFAYFVVEAPGHSGQVYKALYWVDAVTFSVRGELPGGPASATEARTQPPATTPATAP